MKQRIEIEIQRYESQNFW